MTGHSVEQARLAGERAEALSVAALMLERVVNYWDGRPLRMHGDHIYADLVDVLHTIQADVRHNREEADVAEHENAGRRYDVNHCDACGDFLPCGRSWLDEVPDNVIRESNLSSPRLGCSWVAQSLPHVAHNGCDGFMPRLAESAQRLMDYQASAPAPEPPVTHELRRTADGFRGVCTCGSWRSGLAKRSEVVAAHAQHVAEHNREEADVAEHEVEKARPLSEAEAVVWEEFWDTDAAKCCSCPACNYYAPDYEAHKDEPCLLQKLIERIIAAREANHG